MFAIIMRIVWYCAVSYLICSVGKLLASKGCWVGGPRPRLTLFIKSGKMSSLQLLAQTRPLYGNFIQVLLNDTETQLSFLEDLAKSNRDFKSR